VGTDLVLSMSGDGASSDELRSLRAWLLQEDGLRGRVETVDRPPDADRLGPVLEALRIVADPASGVLTAVVLAWLRTRVGSVRLVLRRPSVGSVELEASHVRGLDADALAELTERISHLVNTDAGTDRPAYDAGAAERDGEQGTGA
jgi:Effector Associated Constant Component 1